MASINEAFWGLALDRNHSSSIQSSNHTTNFNDLPTEIRLKIIHLSFFDDNVVIDMNSSSFPKRVSPTPIALRINHEFRFEALQHYKLLGHCSELLFMEKPKTWIYFNYKTDLITFTRGKDGKLQSGAVKFITNTIPEGRLAEITVVLTDFPYEEMLDLIVPMLGISFRTWETIRTLLRKRIGQVIIHAKDQDTYEGFEDTVKEMIESEEFIKLQRFDHRVMGVLFTGLRRLDGGLGIVFQKEPVF